MTDQPDIVLAGITIHEPVIALTGVLVCIVGFIGYYRTRHVKNDLSLFLYRLFLLFIGLSALSGSILSHAFLYKFGENIKFISWIFSLVGVSFAAQGALLRAKDNLGARFYFGISLINLTSLVIFSFLACVKKEFFYVEIHTAVALLLIVFVIEQWIYIKQKSRISLNILAGVGMLIIAVLFHIFKISLTKWFNYFDFGHVFMAICLFFFYFSISKYHSDETVNAKV